MDFSFRFDLWFARLPASPRGVGRIEHCVVRLGPGLCATPASSRVTPDGDVEGDLWARNDPRRAGNLITLINVHVLRSLAGGDEERMPLAGDNLHVDLDLSEANLPAGTRLAIGDALIEITPDPHRPCRSFHELFGAIAAKKVARAKRTRKRGRGLMACVLRAGTIRLGDAIEGERASVSQ